MLLSVGDQIGPYTIVAQVGSGGMATVYKAYHERLDRTVAIKLMHAAFLQDSEFLSRFEREAQIVARLDHPNVIPIFDADEHQGQPYLVMKYVEGKTLKDMVRKGPLPLGEIRRLMGTVADALTYAHERGVLHRDIKPSNIIVDANGTPYLTDFGLARLVQSGESTMSVDTMLGTPHYISPEQAQGQPNLDARTDVYSLGVILYEQVTGRVPFTGESAYAIVHKHIYAAPPAPSELYPDVPPAVERVLLRALAKDPADRYAAPNDLMQAFEQAVTTSGLQTLDASRAQVATARAGDISERTPGGGRYVEVSLSPGEAAGDFFQQIGERVRSTFDEVQGELRRSDAFREIADGVKEAVQEIKDNVGGSQSDSAAVSRQRAERLISSDWGDNEASIRRRVQQRVDQRRGFIAHVIAFIAVMFLINITAQQGFEAALSQAMLEPDVIAEFDNVGGNFLQPLLNLNIPLMVAMFWGIGLISHGLSVFYNTGTRYENKRQVFREELEEAYGPDWPHTIDAGSYRRVRRRVYERYKKRLGFLSHVVAFVMITAVAFIVWAPIQEMLTIIATNEPEMMEFVNFPMPGIVAALMGLSVLMHGIGLLFSQVAGPDARERAIQREIARERELSLRQPRPKAKREAAAEKLKTDDTAALPVRLNEDGELTESFVQELENPEKHKNG